VWLLVPCCMCWPASTSLLEGGDERACSRKLLPPLAIPPPMLLRQDVDHAGQGIQGRLGVQKCEAGAVEEEVCGT